MSVPIDGQPRVHRNDYGSLRPPTLGAWEPTLSVSVIIPAFRTEHLLPSVLAGLAAQTYPARLLEVIVVDDGNDPPLVLPEVRPERTRLLLCDAGWGKPASCATGARAADGEVVHWLDSDMLCEADEVEAQLRWHHLIDYAVVLGDKLFVDPEPVLAAAPDEVRRAVAERRIADYFDGQTPDPHDWVEDLYARTDDLRAAGPRAHRAFVGAATSMRADLYRASGGMDPAMQRGEDSELAYRLAESGAVFIPDRAAKSWHLGPTHVMRRQGDVNDYNAPFLADRVPDMRAKRVVSGRRYAVPYLEVVLDTLGQVAGEVITCVDALLASSLPDLEVALIGPWHEVDDAVRFSPLNDPQRDLRMLRAAYVSEPRVRLDEALPTGRCRAMFRLTLPSARWSPEHRALSRLLRDLELTHHGLRSVLLPDGAVVVIERTAAVERARLLVGVDAPVEALHDVIDETFGSWWLEGAESGFVPTASRVVGRLPGIASPALNPADLPPYQGTTDRPRGAARPTEARASDPAPAGGGQSPSTARTRPLLHRFAGAVPALVRSLFRRSRGSGS